MAEQDLAERLARLEAVQDIQALKARYLAACDAKDCDTFRGCFVDGPVDIDYGAVGRFDTADALTAVFREVGCRPNMLEWHHAVNPRIEIDDVEHARGHWGLHYQLIDTQANTLTQLGGEYEDEYRKLPAGWKIAATRFTPRTQLVLELDAQAVRALAAGQPGMVAA